MTPFDMLETSLLDLLFELRDTDLKLILGGGYGLHLKERMVRDSGARTLIEHYPQDRPTNDLDIFLHTEILTNAERARTVREALERLGYHAKPGAEYYQFVTDRVKIDLLTAPEKLFDAQQIRIESGKDGRRIKPKQKGVGLHAHSANEAVTIQEDLIHVSVKGYRTSGESYKAMVLLPHPFTYATMKVFATRDKEQRGQFDNSSKHALDLYRILAMITANEWSATQRLSREYRQDPAIQEAAHIVNEYFSRREAPGMIRMREHSQYSSEMDISSFMEILAQIFPG